MAEVVVARIAEVPQGTHIVVQAHGREIGIFNIHGAYYALPNNCFHQNGPVCTGVVGGAIIASAETGWKKTWAYDGEILICPWHALEFDVKTGQCLAFPNKKLPAIPVRVDGDEIKVSL
jgi:nitrite reductase/ring-hydroxylating ferredoxin subunit